MRKEGKNGIKEMRVEETLERWHDFVASPSAEILEEIMADEVKFHSPFVWKPKEGKEAAIVLLMTVAEVFQNFAYIRQLVAGNHLALEFEARVDGLNLRGIDLLELNADGKIVDFEVMIRPANGLQALGMEMAKRLMQKSAATQEMLTNDPG
jgi:hypothetical protein